MKKREIDEINKSFEPSEEPHLKKERRTGFDDVYSRTLLTKTHGRGSLTGWGICPLCNTSSKKYALGRGITMHLNEVHKPWQPLKAELARRERIRRKCTGIIHRIRQGKITEDDRKDPLFKLLPEEDEWDRTEETLLNTLLQNALGEVWNRDSKLKPICYEPNSQEVAVWAEKVIELAQKAEAEYERNKSNTAAGRDRDGNLIKSYDQSLPPLLIAAKDGQLEEMKDLVNQFRSNRGINAHNALQEYLKTVDRNGSNAYHWAAGGGHLECLDYLFSLSKCSDTVSDHENRKTHRRRDGKTCLHYAARNGQTHIIDYLVKQTAVDIDVTSGDGTTPLHLACFGGHLKTIRCLIETHCANRSLVNEWGCGIGHWIAMTIQKDEKVVVSALEYLKQLEPHSSFNIFGKIQKQGHSSVHKAAQKLNKAVLMWLAEESKQNWSDTQRCQAGGHDLGGHKPSEIWKKMGGDETFADWLERECSW